MMSTWELCEKYLEALQGAITGSLPQGYSMKNKVASINWGTIENRDYLRSLNYLAQGYYAIGNYKKAKQWFLFLTHCTSREIGLAKYFLKDMRSQVPYGDLHEMEGEYNIELFETGD